MIIEHLRKTYHQRICSNVIRTIKGYPNFADGSNRASCSIAWEIANRLGYRKNQDEVGIQEQTVGNRFETYTEEFLESSFKLLQHLRPDRWNYFTRKTDISIFEQYEHLKYMSEVITKDNLPASAIGGDYIVKPDIIIARAAILDTEINQQDQLIEDSEKAATLTPLRQINRPNQPHWILHASISCKWTIRSDRSQNTRTEALNLIRNRKGPLPHVIAVTAEPLPTRISTLALGTGDLDCVYHFALYELEEAIKEIKNEDQFDLLTIMVEGRRLRDISDLPFDLAI